MFFTSGSVCGDGGGNQWYRDDAPREAKTLCGAEPTDHDVRWFEKPTAFGTWVPCGACVALVANGDTQDGPSKPFTDKAASTAVGIEGGTPAPLPPTESA